ncbi:MAG: glycoside hydrolase family 3 C-terminal domain-containing protein [Oscillospiraceae bacterium]|nr:glycoside hydrolase family 3 C-terminal domain-containing protein [Oscillospiraceae bacterium]
MQDIVIFNVGGSIDTTLIKEKADAILDVFVPGFNGGYAIADVLNGSVNPSGRLTQTFPTKFEYTAPMAMARRLCMKTPPIFPSSRSTGPVTRMLLRQACASPRTTPQGGFQPRRHARPHGAR